jgi:hypothetical protein
MIRLIALARRLEFDLERSPCETFAPEADLSSNSEKARMKKFTFERSVQSFDARTEDRVFGKVCA